MPTNIKCPKCSFEFPIEDAVSEEYKKELREQMVNFKKQKEEELNRKEQEWKQQLLQQEKERLNAMSGLGLPGAASVGVPVPSRVTTERAEPVPPAGAANN